MCAHACVRPRRRLPCRSAPCCTAPPCTACPLQYTPRAEAATERAAEEEAGAGREPQFIEKKEAGEGRVPLPACLTLPLPLSSAATAATWVAHRAGSRVPQPPQAGWLAGSHSSLPCRRASTAAAGWGGRVASRHLRYTAQAVH